jgi:glycosyltransferase involved in cell wall biosynthesis
MLGFFLNYTRNGGAEQYFYSLAKSFHENGVNSEFYSGGGDGLPSGFVSNKFRNMYICSDNFSTLTFVKKLYLLLIPFIGIYTGFKYFNKLKKLEYVICSHPYPSILAQILSKFFKFKVVKVVHHILPNEYSDLERFFGRADKYIAVSHEVQDFLLSKGIESDVIYNPIECDIEINLANRDKVIMLSHVHEDKGLSIETFCNVANLYTNMDFEILGECTSKFACELIKSYPKVKFYGSLPRIEALKYVNENAKIFIGVGRSAVEAAILGIPTIVAGHVTGKLGGNFGGLILPENVSAISYNNYSGRNGVNCTSNMLLPCFESAVSSGPSTKDLLENKAMLIDKHNLNNIRRQFESICVIK